MFGTEKQHLFQRHCNNTRFFHQIRKPFRDATLGAGHLSYVENEEQLLCSFNKKIFFLNVRINIKPHCLAFLIGKLYLIIISLDTRIKVETHIIWFFDVYVLFNILPPSHTLDKHSDENENGNEWMPFGDWFFVRKKFF